MKRSEMIKLIKDHMVEHQFMERTKAAELLLNMLENKGMNAPPVGPGHPYWDSYIPINAWDDE